MGGGGGGVEYRAQRLEDRLGWAEPAYRSRGEAQVGRVLDRYGIPALYEQATPIYVRGRWRTWRPDFTLPSYDHLIVEYAGMPDRSDYVAGLRVKRDAYVQNGRPAVFIYPHDLRGPAWPLRMVAKIDRAYGRRSAYRG